MAIYAQLSCEMPRDSRMIAAGPLGRLVYIEALLYCRENLTDGLIERIALKFWCPDIGTRARAKHLDRLAEVGALVQVDDGWAFPDHVWQKWNPSKSEVEGKRDAERQRKADYRAKRRDRHDHSPEDVPSGHIRPGTSRGRQPEPEPEEKPEPEPMKSSAQLNTERSQPVDDDDFVTTVEHIVQARVDQYQPANPNAYRMRVRTSVIDEHGETIRMLLDDGNTPELTARHVLGTHLEQPATPRAIPWCNTQCECDGTGFTETTRGFAPCPHRHSEEHTG